VETTTLPPIEDEHIIRSGRLAVGDGHELYWVDWGNPEVQNPIFYLHGGPGGGFSERNFKTFDPSKHRVVFHDQRGSGRSTPFASTENNTSQDLVEDIVKLRKHLEFNKVSLYGFSWGSTLALLYSIAHPQSVEKMLIGGIYLSREADADFYLRGRISSHFPEVWERFSSLVPEKEQANIAEYYRKKMASADPAERQKFAKEWMVYEGSILQLDYVPGKAESSLFDMASESLSYLEAHYITNNCFISENYILDNATKIKHIETVIVHGRYDFICMPEGALALKRALGDKAKLHFVMAGHSRGDTVYREVVHAYVSMLW